MRKINTTSKFLALAGLIGAATLVLGPARLASAQAVAPSWSYTGSLNTARSSGDGDMTATLLTNGKVLVAGYDSAELYDPATGTWSITGNPISTNGVGTATLLLNGKVLVSGYTSAELYDPVTGTWSTTGNLNTARGRPTATLLPNGKVLVTGGYRDGLSLNSAELYDPATGTWSITGSLNIVRGVLTAMLLPNGKVLVVGGNANKDSPLSSAELYDPATGTWSITGNLNTASGYFGIAALLHNGKVLVLGSNSAELYDPATGTWSITGNLNTEGGPATLLHNGKVLVAGYYNSELYDPATGTWSITSRLNTGRESYTMTLLANGKVLVAGGSDGNQDLNSAELYDPGASSSFEPVALGASDVTLDTWTLAGRTSAYLKLTFPDAGFRIADFGSPVRFGTDFSADPRVEHFSGASVQAVKTTAQIYDLGTLAPGDYTFTFKNSGWVVKSLAFTVSGGPPAPNMIDDQRQFVRQQYLDFLSREPDGPGWDFWTDNITKCSDPSRRPATQTEAQCIERQRETTSAAFFLSPEFQNTGYFVLRVYRGSLGRMPFFGGSVPADNAKDEFTRDATRVSAGIVVNNTLSPLVINANKQTFVNEFVTRPEFRAIFDSLTTDQYVDKLFQTTGVTPTSTERTDLINGLNGGTETRASVLQKVVDGINVISEGNQQFTTTYGQAFYEQQSNRAFVLLEYFGYMKRDPDDAGYAFWLGKLNQFGGNFVNAEMVLAFISSPEYRARFGQP